MPDTKGIGIAAIAAGGLLAYAGVKGYSIGTTIQNLVTGKSPLKQAQATAVGTPSGESPTTSGNAPPPGPGGTYSDSQLQSLWRLAGGNPAAARTASCIAMHESSGNPDATSANPDGGTNVGLWQLDTKGKGAGHTVEQLKDPLTNARVAVQGSSNGNDWSAWATAPMCGV